MIQGEPLEETQQNSAPSVDSVHTDSSSADLTGANAFNVGAVMQVPDRADDRLRNGDALSVAMGLSAQDDQNDSLDTDVKEFVETLANVERERDDDWIAAAKTDPVSDFDPFTSDQNDDGPEHSTLAQAMAELEEVDRERAKAQAKPADKIETRDTIAAPDADAADQPKDIPPKSESASADKPATAKDDAPKATEDAPAPAPSVDPAPVERDATPKSEATEEPVKAEDAASTESNMLGLQAISILNEKISSTEGRYDDALDKIGHALGMIAERIDGLEGRMTSDTITKVALAAAPAEPEELFSAPSVSDDAVAPYIAQAERELEARKGSSSMDIFDRIAKAAETEYNGQTGSIETRILDNPSAGRRVGTKRWQPSKTVKRRMEQLEKAKKGELTGDPSIDIMPEDPRSLRADLEEITSGVNAPKTATTAAKPMLDLGDEIDMDSDAGLSVVPGARGRRRNRARKSRLDEDFENVFEETGDKPSIQSLRRKMRDLPVEAPEEEETKGGMLSGILGKKSAKKVASEPAAAVEDGEDDMMAAFGAPEESVASTPKKAKKAKAAPMVELDDDEEGWEDEEASKGINFAGGPLLYVLIAGAAAAAFFLWQMFMG